MTSWPWMTNIAVAIADPPVAPICDEDERPAVKDLIAQHRTAIDAIAKDLATGDQSKSLYDENKHDDLWILRFVLSHEGHLEQALHAAVNTLQFRAEHKLDSIDIRPYPPGPLAKDESFQLYFECIKNEAFHYDIPHPKRGVVAFLSSKGYDLNKLQQLEFGDRVRAICYMNEWTHQCLDFVTRTTGRLTKSARLIDAKGVGLMQVNYETLRLEAKAVATLQDYYPQLLESFYVCDPPVWAHIPWKILRPLLPSRVVHKIDFIAPGKSKKERKRLRVHLQEEHLPVAYGGHRVQVATT
jgi:CRAL/TRIO domain